MTKTRTIGLIFLTVHLSGCTGQEPKAEFIRGSELTVNLSSNDIDAYATSQDKILSSCYYAATGSKGTLPTDDDPRWRDVFRGCRDYIDQACTVYINSIDDKKEKLLFINRQSNITQTLAGGVVGIVGGVSARTIAIIASSFGAFNATLQNVDQRFLFGIDVTVIRRFTLKNMSNISSYYDSNDMKSRLVATKAIREYVFYCTPSGIRQSVNEALTISQGVTVTEVRPPATAGEAATDGVTTTLPRFEDAAQIVENPQ